MNANFHIGDEIRKELRIQERTITWLANRIGKDSGNLRRQLNSQHLKTDLLHDISVALELDFLQFYSLKSTLSMKVQN